MRITKRPRWQLQGSDPDYRFSLANERTFLAWIRTALALLGGGLVVTQLAVHAAQPRITSAIGLALIVLAMAVSAGSYFHWKNNEIALRSGQPLPGSGAMAITAAALLLVCAALALAVIASPRHG